MLSLSSSLFVSTLSTGLVRAGASDWQCGQHISLSAERILNKIIVPNLIWRVFFNYHFLMKFVYRFMLSSSVLLFHLCLKYLLIAYIFCLISFLINLLFCCHSLVCFYFDEINSLCSLAESDLSLLSLSDSYLLLSYQYLIESYLFETICLLLLLPADWTS